MNRIIRRSILAGLLILGLAVVTGLANASPFSSNVTNDVYSGVVNGIPTANGVNDGIPDIFDAINQLVGAGLANNAGADPRFVQPDDIWHELNGSIALIGLTAAYTNTVGVYTGLGTGTVQTPLMTSTGFGFAGNGTTVPYPYATFSLDAPKLFGWYLYANQTTNYYSESILNAGGWDHMMTFKLPELAGVTVNVVGGTHTFTKDAYLIAWEDLPFGNGVLGDDDYDDMMFVVDKVAPVPIPGSILLLGSGLAGLGFFRRRIQPSK
jgi:hypothetical protein